MTSVSQTLDAELAVISQAVRSGQIRHADGEYLIQQRYQLALMQYEVFSALHDSLAYEIAQTPVAAPHSQTSCRSDAILVVPGPPSRWHAYVTFNRASDVVVRILPPLFLARTVRSGGGTLRASAAGPSPLPTLP